MNVRPHPIWLLLMCLLPLATCFDEDSSSAIDVNVFPSYTPLRIDGPISLEVEIINNDLSKTISAGSNILFEPNNFTRRGVLQITADIAPGARSRSRIILNNQPGVTFRQIPDKIEFHLLDKDVSIVPTSTQSFSFRSDEISRSLMEWTPRKLTAHTWRWWVPETANTYLFGSDVINVCFMGIAGAGKSTTHNTLLTSQLNTNTHESIRPIGGDAEHVTVKVEGIDLTQSDRRLPLAMRFWDTFGLTDTNWPEDKIRGFLNGRLTNYSIYDALDFAVDSKAVPLQDRIHVVLLFMPADVLKNEVLLRRMIETRKIAVNEGYNPLLMVTMTNNLDAEEKELLLDSIQSNFNIPKYQIIFVPFYGEKIERDFFTDRESLYILERIQAAADAFLDPFPLPSKFERSRWMLLCIAAPFILGAILEVLTALCNVLSKRKVIKPSPVALQEEEDFEPEDIKVFYKENSMAVHITEYTTLADILPAVAKNFGLEESAILFVDEDGVTFLNSHYAFESDKIYVKLQTSS